MSEKMAIEQRVEREITARMEELDQKLVAEKLERYRRLNQFASWERCCLWLQPDGAVPHQ